MRVTGDTTWLSQKDWGHFCDYEDGLNEVIGNQRLAVLCTYPLSACGAPQILDVVRTHQFVLARRHGNWDVVETATLKQAKSEIKQLNEELEQRVVERTGELMRASEALRETQTELAHVNRVTAMGQLAAIAGVAAVVVLHMGERPWCRKILETDSETGTQAVYFYRSVTEQEVRETADRLGVGYRVLRADPYSTVILTRD